MSARTVHTLTGSGIPLSAHFTLPAEGAAPRATILAIHGRGMRAGYWDAFTPLATRLGHAVLAVDRPGYGDSAAYLPEGQNLADQAETLRAALKEHARTHDLGAGVFLLGHSDGGKVALHTAAGGTDAPPLLGLDASGVGYHYNPEALHFPSTLGGGATKLNWGPSASTPAAPSRPAAPCSPRPRRASRRKRCGGRASSKPWPPRSASRSASPSRSTRPGGTSPRPPSRR